MWPSSQCAPLPSMSCSVTKNEANVFLSIGLVNNIGKLDVQMKYFSIDQQYNKIEMCGVHTLQQIWQV